MFSGLTANGGVSRSSVGDPFSSRFTSNRSRLGYHFLTIPTRPFSSGLDRRPFSRTSQPTWTQHSSPAGSTMDRDSTFSITSGSSGGSVQIAGRSIGPRGFSGISISGANWRFVSLSIASSNTESPRARRLNTRSAASLGPTPIGTSSSASASTMAITASMPSRACSKLTMPSWTIASQHCRTARMIQVELTIRASRPPSASRSVHHSRIARSLTCFREEPEREY